MSDGAIRKALEVAGKALLAERENMGALTHRVTAPGAKMEERLAAAAITAFLRTLKPERGECWVYEWVTINRSVNSMSAERFAAAIEGAAGGGDE